MKTHTVKQGEDLNKIAYQYGLIPDRIWKLAENEGLAKKRKPHLLREGDELQIPDVKPRETTCATGKQHSFTRKGLTSSLSLCLLNPDDSPRANRPYILEIETEGKAVPDVSGETDEDGYLYQSIPPDAVSARLVLDPGEDETVYTLNISHMDPLDEGWRGVQARLNNIGYPCGKEDDELGPKTLAALRAFQQDYGLPLIEDGAEKIDDETLEKLKAF